MIPPTDLLDRWTSDEARFREYGQDATADVIARCRSELAGWWREHELEALTLEEAAGYSGLAYGTLQNKVGRGEILNVGEKHRPRIRRCDLPAKAPGPPDRDSEALDLADRIICSRAH